MLADVNLITPVRGSEATDRARRRREERRKAQQVVPRRKNSSALNEDTGDRESRTGVSRYA